MALNDSKFEGGGSLSNPSRPNTSDPRVENQNFFPTEAFEFDDPNGIKNNKADVKLKLKPGWKLDANSIILENTNENLNDILDGSGQKIETNRNEISSTQGNMNIISETVYENGVTTEASLELISNQIEDLYQNAQDISDDSKVSATEKQYVREEWNRIQEEYTQITDNIPAGAEKTAYIAVYDALDLYLNTTLNLFNDMTTSTDITRSTWNTKWNDYYTNDQTRSDVIQAAVNLKAEVRNSGGTPVSGAYLTLSAGLGQDSEIKLDADKIVIDGAVTLDNTMTVSGGRVEIDGDLHIDSVDEEFGREIDVGIKGVLVKDSNGVIIHDVPNAVMQTDQVYMGHLLLMNSTTSYTLFGNSNQDHEGSVEITLPSFGNSNVKGCLLDVIVEGDNNAGGAGTDSYAFGIAYPRTSASITTVPINAQYIGNVTKATGEGCRIQSSMTVGLGVGTYASKFVFTWFASRQTVSTGATVVVKLIGVYI